MTKERDQLSVVRYLSSCRLGFVAVVVMICRVCERRLERRNLLTIFDKIDEVERSDWRFVAAAPAVRDRGGIVGVSLVLGSRADRKTPDQGNEVSQTHR